MTKKQTAQIMAVLKAAYPAYYRNQSETDAISAVTLWYEMFKDDDPAEVGVAVKMLIATKVESYPPTIGAVKEKLAEIRRRDDISAQDAWALVNKAVRSVDWFAPEKQFNKLPPAVQMAVGSPSVLKEWGMTDEAAFETVIYSQFIKAYGVYQKREKEMAALPSDVRTMLADISNQIALPSAKEPDGVDMQKINGYRAEIAKRFLSGETKRQEDTPCKS